MKIENVVVISLEDYTEYQELKNKKNNVDFDKLKTGSVVMLNVDKNNDLTAGTSSNYRQSNKYNIILIESDLQISAKGVYKSGTKRYTSAVDDFGNFIHIIDFSEKHIEEVISY